MDKINKNEGLPILEGNLRSFGRVLIAFPGGLQPLFLLSVARDMLGADNVMAAVNLGRAVERQRARNILRRLGIKHIIFRNSGPRGKEIFFKELHATAKRHGMVLCDNADFSDIALTGNSRSIEIKWGVAPLLAMAGITKKEAMSAS